MRHARCSFAPRAAGAPARRRISVPANVDTSGNTEQFHLLLHQEVMDSVGYDGDDWMTVAVELCPQRIAT